MPLHELYHISKEKADHKEMNDSCAPDQSL